MIGKFVNEIGGADSIGLFGDYDCDGVCSSFIVSAAYGIEPSVFASRSTGYGATRYRHNKPHCVITDCGLNEDVGGIFKRCLVIDHHKQIKFDHDESVTIVTPETIGESDICSTQIAAEIAISEGKNVENGIGLEAAVAIACIADNVSIKGAKWKQVVRDGIDKIRKITKQSTIKSVRDVAFRICPAINSAGRIATAEAAFRFVSTGKYEHWFRLKEANDKRREMTKEAEDKAAIVSLVNDIAFFEVPDKYKPVISILASKYLREIEGLLAVGVGIRVDGKLQGSFRCRAGFDAFALQNDDVRFAGHSQACGFVANSDLALPELKFPEPAAEPTKRNEVEFSDLGELREKLLEDEPIALKDLEEYSFVEMPKPHRVYRIAPGLDILYLQNGWKMYSEAYNRNTFKIDSINKVLF